MAEAGPEPRPPGPGSRVQGPGAECKAALSDRVLLREGLAGQNWARKSMAVFQSLEEITMGCFLQWLSHQKLSKPQKTR